MRLSRPLAGAALFLVVQAVACGRGSDDSASASEIALSETTVSPVVTAPVSTAGPAYREQSNAVVVAGANQYLAAWRDTALATKTSKLVVARLASDGTLLDREPIALPELPGGEGTSVALAFDGTGYLAVWSHKSGTGSIIAGVRVGNDGKLLDREPFKLGRAIGNATMPAVAYTPGGYLVVWSDDRDAGVVANNYRTEVYGARVSTAGTVVGSAEGFRISAMAGVVDGKIEIAAAGSTFLVGYGKRMGSAIATHADRVNAAGEVLGPVALGLTGSAPTVASDGDRFFVACHDRAGQRVAGARVTQDGTTLDAAPIVIGTKDPAPPTMTWDGEAFSVAWPSLTQRVGNNGALVGDPLPGGSAVASVGASLLVLQNIAADEARRLPARIGASLLPKAPGAESRSNLTLSRGASIQRDVATASHGTSSLSVWLEYEDAANPKINGALFANGVATPIAIDAGTTANAAPAVAWDGNAYVVAWQTTTGAELKSSVVHVSDTGQLTDSPRSFAGGFPALTPGPSNRVLLTTSRAAVGTVAYYVDADRPAFTTSSEPEGWKTSPVGQAWDGNRFVLAWTASNAAGIAEVHAQRFDKGGRPMDVPALKLATIGVTASRPLPTPTLASNGAETLVAWESTAHHTVDGLRLSGGGAIESTPFRLAENSAGFLYAPRVAFDGKQYLVAYERRLETAREDPAGYVVELSRVKTGPAGLAISGMHELGARGTHPTLAVGSAGVTFFSYESVGTDEVAAPRATLGLFTDKTSPDVSAPGSGGTTAPGDDDDDSVPVAPDGDDAVPTKPAKPAGPKGEPTKGATIKPLTGGADASGDDSGGCSTTGSSPTPSSSSLLFVAIAALVSRRFARRTRVPHLRR